MGGTLPGSKAFKFVNMMGFLKIYFGSSTRSWSKTFVGANRRTEATSLFSIEATSSFFSKRHAKHLYSMWS
jgi:hypothetical protein